MLANLKKELEDLISNSSGSEYSGNHTDQQNENNNYNLFEDSK